MPCFRSRSRVLSMVRVVLVGIRSGAGFRSIGRRPAALRDKVEIACNLRMRESGAAMSRVSGTCLIGSLMLGIGLGLSVQAQTPAPAAPQTARPEPPLRARQLRGEYGPHRANNDLLFYHLDVRVDPEK